MNEVTKPSEYIGDFCRLIEQGKQCWIDAGKLLAKAVEEIPGFTKKLIEARPELTESFIRKMIDLGHGSLHPELLIASSSGERRLARLSYSWQEKYVASPVELLIKKGDEFDTLLVPVRDLTPEQCNQVFDDSGVRTAAQQRVHIENYQAKKSEPKKMSVGPYRVVNDKIVMMELVTLTRKDLLRMLTEIS